MSEKTENNKERITKLINTAFIECYKEGFDDGYKEGNSEYDKEYSVLSAFKAYRDGKKEMLDKIKADIMKIASRYTISRERGAMGQVEWSDRLIKESEILQIIDKYKAESEDTDADKEV